MGTEESPTPVFGGPKRVAFETPTLHGGIGGIVAVKFQDDDVGYVWWVAQHASGFVLNCERHPKPDYLIVHAATCHSITRRQPAGKHWTMRYIKVCADDVADIEAWVRATMPAGTAWPCPICSPLGPVR